MQSFVVFVFILFSFPIHGRSSEYFENPYRYCSNAKFSPSSTYFSNLKILSSTLSSNSSHKMYHNSSVGQPPNPTAYGHFQCRGDVDAAACRKCVATATSNSSQKFCPLSVAAVVWLDECFLRYSNKPFFSIVAEQPWVMMWNVINVEKDDVAAFDKIVVTTLKGTAGNASSSVKGMLKFATKEVNFGNETVYTLAECSGDLSNSDCAKCLRDGIGMITGYCSGKVGARFLSPSCMARYELYPFYGGVSPSFISTPLAPAPVPVLPPPAAPSLPSSPSAPEPSAAAPSLLSGKGRATVAMAIGIVVAGILSRA